ncbi:MAG TPA: site-2 protease family protein [Pyrinomonadaceae bacterium]|nr:site-2 protease family protein [Pyrinomonadaceae bacterium]
MTDPDSIDRQFLFERPVPRPTARTYIKHLALLAITFCTATIAGTLYPFGIFAALPDSKDPETISEFAQMLVSLPAKYVGFVVDAVSKLFSEPANLAYGLKFSISLLFILICHEMGHYVACRLYKVDATLPFFIPTPPMIGPAGTFGAFIKILSPMPSRRAIFDIGVAGPIAGFIALIPVALIGVATMQAATTQQLAAPSGLIFADPLFMRVAGSLMGHDPSVSVGNAFYYAAWVGLLVTALNLIPSGQLDGGHAIYAVLGETIHKWTGRVAFVVMASLSILGLIFFNSPSGFLIAVILGIMMRIKHPMPYDQTPLDGKRKVIAVLTLVIFVLCFVPFPIRIN